MDLNLLYSQHQTSLIRASAAKNQTVRFGHEAQARQSAHSIAAFQRTLDAPAAFAWSVAS